MNKSFKTRSSATSNSHRSHSRLTEPNPISSSALKSQKESFEEKRKEIVEYSKLKMKVKQVVTTLQHKKEAFHELEQELSKIKQENKVLEAQIEELSKAKKSVADNFRDIESESIIGDSYINKMNTMMKSDKSVNPYSRDLYLEMKKKTMILQYNLNEQLRYLSELKYEYEKKQKKQGIVISTLQSNNQIFSSE